MPSATHQGIGPGGSAGDLSFQRTRARDRSTGVPPKDDPCAILIDGGPGGLAAAWAASACQDGGAGRPVFLLCIPRSQPARLAAARKLISLAGVTHVVELHVPETPRFSINSPTAEAGARQVLSHILLEACAEAMKLDVSRLIWPVHSGAATEADLRTDMIADICDRSVLASQLASLDAPRTGPGSRGVRIETPYADLTDMQVAELIVDFGAPLAACWWCDAADGSRGCATCSACRRWNAALKAAGARAISTAL